MCSVSKAAKAMAQSLAMPKLAQAAKGNSASVAPAPSPAFVPASVTPSVPPAVSSLLNLMG